MPLRFEQYYRVKRRDNLGDPDYWNARFSDLDRRLTSSEEALADVGAVGNRVEAVALARLDTVVTPMVVEAKERLHSLSNLFTAESISSITVETGEKTFVILENQRRTFASIDYVSIRKVGDASVSLLGQILSYDVESGELVVDVQQTSGTGTHDEWRITISSPPDLVHATVSGNPHGTTAGQVGAYSTIQTDSAIAAAIEALKGGAPTNRDTLKELSDALNAVSSSLSAGLNAKSDKGHNHDELYYTKAAVDGIVNIAKTHGTCQLAYVSATQIKLSGYGGQYLDIGGTMRTIPSAGVTLSNSGLSANTSYFVYAYLSGSNMTLEASTTAPADHTNGVRIKTSDNSRTLVGQVRTNASSQFALSEKQVFVRSWFNDPGLAGFAKYSTSRTATTALVEPNSEIRVEFLAWDNERIDVRFTGSCANNTSSTDNTVAVAIDSTATMEDGRAFWRQTSGGAPTCIGGGRPKSFARGYHYLTLLAQASSGTLTLRSECTLQAFSGPRA